MAKKLYLSGNDDFKNFILTVYNENELKDPPYAKYKSVKDILGYEFRTEWTEPSFLSQLRDKLNEETNIDYLFGPIYLPVIKVIPNLEFDNAKHIPLAKFSLNNRVFYLVEGNENEYIAIDGIFNIARTSGSIGALSMHSTYLAFASPEIAQHAVKYFHREIFEAITLQFHDTMNIKWLVLN